MSEPSAPDRLFVALWKRSSPRLEGQMKYAQRESSLSHNIGLGLTDRKGPAAFHTLLRRDRNLYDSYPRYSTLSEPHL